MSNSDGLVAEIEEVGARLARAREMVGRRIIGQDDAVEQVLIAILCGGHALLVGVPGLAKTRLVETLGTVLGLNAHRIQFTPDLMPADILGAEVLETGADGTRAFRFIDGPIFCQLLMGDEINRASPRTQSALLQAMQEKEVSIAGQRRQLPRPFHVLATQNPIEQEGTYPLPEAQLDRFLLQVELDYPNRDAERRIILATTGVDDATAEPVFDAASLVSAQRLVRRLPVGEAVVDGVLDLVRAARPGTADAHPLVTQQVSWGPGPRAAQALMLAVRARALLRGRLVPDLTDVAALARPILIHRMALGFAARAEGRTLDQLIAQLVSDVMRLEAAA
ncbi:MAG: AAA family ATPase [Rhodovulum sulfidophilum]|uniref:AAA family ATPase n=1 Tax=Rhodovulum sulfidophilum TaxID=35806 RepID=A0A2W5QAE0_RHOSU|nr:MAG: AAA family ATPase [Rhodovulum sulfidophilum]